MEPRSLAAMEATVGPGRGGVRVNCMSHTRECD